MARWEKRGKGTYRLIVEAGKKPDGSRDRRTKTVHCRNGTEADIELAKFVVEIKTGAPQEQPSTTSKNKLTLIELYEKWDANYASDDKIMSPNSAYNYRRYLKRFILNVLGSRYVDEITTLDLVDRFGEIKKMISQDGKPFSKNTIVMMQTATKSLFERAVEWYIIEKNPMDGVKVVKEDRFVNKDMYYERDERDTVIEKIMEYFPLKWAIYFLTGLVGGFRPGEIRALEWTDVDEIRGGLYVRKSITRKLPEIGVVLRPPKNKPSFRFVAMPKWYMSLLKDLEIQWAAEREAAGGAWRGGNKQYIFHAGHGEPFSSSTPQNRWVRFLKDNNLRRITIHGLRHTMATMLLDEGVNLRHIQGRIGHARLSTTEIYAHITRHAEQNISDHLEHLAEKITIDTKNPAPKWHPVIDTVH